MGGDNAGDVASALTLATLVAVVIDGTRALITVDELLEQSLVLRDLDQLLSAQYVDARISDGRKRTLVAPGDALMSTFTMLVPPGSGRSSRRLLERSAA
jgi:hypothetical protein